MSQAGAVLLVYLITIVAAGWFFAFIAPLSRIEGDYTSDDLPEEFHRLWNLGDGVTAHHKCSAVYPASKGDTKVLHPAPSPSRPRRGLPGDPEDLHSRYVEARSKPYSDRPGRKFTY